MSQKLNLIKSGVATFLSIGVGNVFGMNTKEDLFSSKQSSKAIESNQQVVNTSNPKIDVTSLAIQSVQDMVRIAKNRIIPFEEILNQLDSQKNMCTVSNINRIFKEEEEEEEEEASELLCALDGDMNAAQSFYVAYIFYSKLIDSGSTALNELGAVVSDRSEASTNIGLRLGEDGKITGLTDFLPREYTFIKQLKQEAMNKWKLYKWVLDRQTNLFQVIDNFYESIDLFRGFTLFVMKKSTLTEE